MSETAGEARPARGRPKDPAKREALLRAARRLFLDHGFEAVTVDDVVGAAHVSRATFYANFADKSALLEAIVARESDRIAVTAAEEAERADRLEASLASYGVRFLAFLSDPDMIAMERLVASARRSGADLVQRLYAAGPGRNLQRLARMISAAHDAGVIDVDDPRQAMSDLIGLWQGLMRLELTFDQRPTPGAEELEAMAARGVRQFMRLYAERSKS